MTRAELKDVVKALTVQRHQLMFEVKQKVYAGEFQARDDAHGNFKRRADALNLLPKEVLMVDMWKHWDAIQNGDLTNDPDGGLTSRFADFLNYAELLYGLLMDEVKAADRMIQERALREE